ncbi:MAG: MMPL family transporter [SAR324 cluster bacterium]|nr:MMPL family transporter [SAR324 cluster bacterium]
MILDACTRIRRPAVLATVVRVEGSAYRRPGARMLISEDGRFTSVVLETLAFSADSGEDLLSGFADTPLPGGDGGGEARNPLSDEENSAVLSAVAKVMDRFRAADFRLYVAGSPVVTDRLKREMQRNMGRFVGLALLAIGAFLLVLFRRISGVALPMLVVLLSLVTTVSLMAANGVAFKLPLMTLPSFLLAVGVGASVHLLTVFYRAYEADGDKEAAVIHALGHSGLPIAMTSLTTAAGLFSFVTAALAPVSDLGIFAGIGVLISLAYTLVMVPALLALLPVRRHARWVVPGGRNAADRILTGIGEFATRRSLAVVVAAAVLVVAAAAGLPRLNFSHNTLLWFPKSSQVRQSCELIDAELKGSISVEVVIDTGQENGLYEPAILNDLERLARFAENYRDEQGRRFVGKTSSVGDVVKEIHKALNENREEFYRIPRQRELIAQELLLFENSGSDDLERIVDSQFSKARLTVKTPWDDAAAYVRFVAELQQEGERLFGDRAEITTTGLTKLLTQTLFALMSSMVTSYSIALVVITVMMILLIGRLSLGLLSMIPNLAPIVVTLGFMGWVGLPLDAFTLLIGSIALGLAVDDTIHFFHNFRRYYAQTPDVDHAVRETLLSTGRAMVFTTLVLVTGFWLFMFASLNNVFNFGLLTGITLVVALLADILLAPAMLELVTRNERRARAPAQG